VLTQAQAKDPASKEADPSQVLGGFLRGVAGPLDLAALDSVPCPRKYLDGARYLVPLRAGHEVLGFLTLSDRVTREAFSAEDFDLLKTIASQASAGLLNLRLSERLLKAREMEAFQTLSAFFIHDLKNLASRLSLTLQNLPVHYHDPAFREDLLAVISRSVDKINGMCSRLSPLSRDLELVVVESDLNKIISSTVEGLRHALRAEVAQDFSSLPPLRVDPEQLQKVVTNLLLNASDAVGELGKICISTEQREEWAVLSVADNGCGMSQEYVAQALFQPFRTTKERGLGIGLFHSKKIIEAHSGRLEVETEQDKGSTFRVILPLSGPVAERIGSRPPLDGRH